MQKRLWLPILGRQPLAPAGMVIALLMAAFPAAAVEPLPMAVLKFGFLNTSGEQDDLRSEHEARLDAVREELRRLLDRSEKFRLVDFQGGDPDCAPEDSDCILKSARETGADVVLAGAIQKGSTMDIKLWAGAFETEGGERIFFRQMALRGDTDEAWLRGAGALVEQLEAASLGTTD